MSKSSPFGYQAKTNFENKDFGGIQDGELVKVICLDIVYPNAYLKTLEERNKANSDEAESMGLPFKPDLPSFKEGGVQLNYAVLLRDKKTGKLHEKVFHETDGGLKEPSYVAYGIITQHTPKYLYDNGYNYERKGGDNYINKLGKPVIIDCTAPRQTGQKA